MDTYYESGRDTLPKTEWPAYVQACVVKQCGVTPEVAAERVAELTAAQVAEIREAGRLGQIARVHELLLADLAETAEGDGEPEDVD